MGKRGVIEKMVEWTLRGLLIRYISLVHTEGQILWVVYTESFLFLQFLFVVNLGVDLAVISKILNESFVFCYLLIATGLMLYSYGIIEYGKI